MNSQDMHAPPTWGRRLLGMEGLRGIAATTVLIGHVGIHLARDTEFPGPVDSLLYVMGQGLTLFFALSGFLLYRPFAAAIISGEKWPSVRRYAWNRVLRIMPAYAVILVLVCFVLGAAYTESVPRGQAVEGAGETVGFLSDPLMFIANLFMVHTLVPSTIKTGLGVSWSLTVELIFYVVLPLVAIVAFQIARRRSSGLRLAIAGAVPVIFLVTGVMGSWMHSRFLATVPSDDHFWYEWGGNWHAVFARSFIAHADLFAFGMVAAVVVVMLERGLIAERGRVIVGVAAVVALLVGAGTGTKVDSYSDTWWALGCGAVILIVALPTRNRGHSAIAYALELLPFRYVGLVSYSLYLWHIPVIWLLRRWDLTFGQTLSGFMGNVALTFTVSVVLSTVTYYLIEAPALRLKSRTKKQADALPETAVTSR